MTITLVVTTSLKWAITLSILGSLLVNFGALFKDDKPGLSLTTIGIGVVMLLLSIWAFLAWVWSL